MQSFSTIFLPQMNKDEIDGYIEFLDQTFPERVLRCILSGNNDCILSQADIQTKLEHLKKQRNDLIAVGILQPNHEQHSMKWIKEQPLSQDTRCFLSIYIEDTEKKLDCYTDLKKKIEEKL